MVREVIFITVKSHAGYFFNERADLCASLQLMLIQTFLWPTNIVPCNSTGKPHPVLKWQVTNLMFPFLATHLSKKIFKSRLYEISSLKNSNLAIMNSISKFLSNNMHCHAAALHTMSTQAAKHPLWLIHLKITWLRQKAALLQASNTCGTVALL